LPFLAATDSEKAQVRTAVLRSAGTGHGESVALGLAGFQEFLNPHNWGWFPKSQVFYKLLG